MTDGPAPYTGATGTAGGAAVPGRPPTDPPTVTAGAPSRTESTKEQARESAQHVADETKESARRVAATAQEHAGETAQVAKETAATTAAEAKAQVSSLLSQSLSEVSDQAGSQQQRLASGLTSLSSELHEMASSSTEQGLAADVVRRLADYADRWGTWLQDREPREVLDEVSAYARRHPGTFLAVAAGLGVLAGRFARGAKDASSSPSREVDATYRTTTPVLYERPNAVPTTTPAVGTGTVPPPPVPPSSPTVSGRGVSPATPTSPGGRPTGATGGGVLP